MIVFSRLIYLQDATVRRGSVLRVPGKYPYENFVDFMLFETHQKDRPYGLIVTSGYKVGLILLYLPGESSSVGGGVDKEWVIANWGNWIYPDCDVSEVFHVDGYEAVPILQEANSE
jgi:hypothetical protein